MLVLICWLALGLLLLYFGAEGFVRGSSSLALRFGVTPLVVGLTVVAFGTSAPEMVVSTKSAYLGQGGIAIGNVIGSNIFNIAVILGLAALIRPMVVKAQLIRFDMPVMIGVSLLCLFLFRDLHLSRPEAGVLFVGILAYTIINVIMARKERSMEVAKEFADGAFPRSRNAFIDFALIIGGLILLVMGARFLVDSAIQMARIWGVAEAVIGLTIVAAGTSLPELATSIVAAVRKQDDIAIGNIVGSNVFNILAILGVSGLVQPLEAAGISKVDFGLMIATAVVLLPLMKSRMLIGRLEGSILLVIYAGYLVWLWP